MRQVKCVVPEKIHTYPIPTPWKVILLGGGGVLEVKFLEAMYENKLEFPGGRGVQKSNQIEPKNLCESSMVFDFRTQSNLIDPIKLNQTM